MYSQYRLKRVPCKSGDRCIYLTSPARTILSSEGRLKKCCDSKIIFYISCHTSKQYNVTIETNCLFLIFDQIALLEYITPPPLRIVLQFEQLEQFLEKYTNIIIFTYNVKLTLTSGIFFFFFAWYLKI